MNLIGNINAIPFRRFRGGGGVVPFPSIPGMIARYSALGLTNEEMSKNPVWVDKTGNGHDLQMKNFAWSGMSGVGGYEMNFNLWTNNVPSISDISMSKTTTSVSVSVGNSAYNNNLIYIHKNNWDVNKNHWLKVASTYEDGDLAFIFYNDKNTKKIELPANGYVNILAYPEFKGSYMYISTTSNKQGSFTIEQLPLYPGALVFDGVDDCGVCDNFPILTKEKGYTVVALRQWISMGEGLYGLVSNVKNWFNDGAFVLEYNSNNATNKFVNRPVSFGNVNIEMDLPNNFTYQTSKSYKGVPITTGSFKGTNSLFVGKLNNIIGNCSNVAIWELVFLDHDATEEELTKIKDYFVKTYPWLFPDQAWTVVGKTNEDEDRATIANITGNGNDLVLSNFSFSKSSGYGIYQQDFNQWVKPASRIDATIEETTVFKISSIKQANITQLYYQSGGSQQPFVVPAFKIKVSGLTDEQKLRYQYREADGTSFFDIDTDGIYDLPSFDFLASGNVYGFIFSKVQETCDITIEQIPEYEGYLVTDGVDDKIESKQPFQLPIKFSMIGSWVFIKKEDKRAGISKENNLIVYDKITGLTLFLNSVESYEEIDIDSFHAISSDGKLYDENWNMLPITVGSILSDSSTLKIAYDGNNFVQFAFNCMGFYDKILKKDDLLKGWIYLKGLKAQRIPPSKNYILKEDGGYVLQEDGNKILTEQQ